MSEENSLFNGDPPEKEELRTWRGHHYDLTEMLPHLKRMVTVQKAIPILVKWAGYGAVIGGVAVWLVKSGIISP